MSRPVTLLVVLLAMLLIGWGVATWTDASTWGIEEDHEPTANDDRGDATVKLKGDPEQAKPEAQSQTPHNDRQELPAAKPKPRYEDIPDNEAIRVRVVLAPDNQAAPDATVIYLPLDFFAKLTTVRRQ